MNKDKKSLRSLGRPAKFIKFENTIAPKSKKNNIVVILAVSISVSIKELMEIFLFKIIISKEPKAPIPAASVAVNIPK